MGILEDYWTAATRRLQIEADGFNRLVNHHGEVGRANELAVVSYFERLLPPNVGVGTGEVIDRHGNRSSQMDIIFYEKHRFPSLLAQGVTLIYPIDTVVLVVEVKTTLNQGEIADIGGKVRSLRALETSIPGRELPEFSVFAFHATVSPATTISHFRTLDEIEWPDSLCVVDPGLIGKVNPDRSDFNGEMVPLHKRDAITGDKILNEWEEVAVGGPAVFERGGATYPVSRLSAGMSGIRVAFEPGRALLLYSVEIMESLARRGLLEASWWQNYLDDATTNTYSISEN